jgi:5-methylcytosine-specific restriction endonuclease McrA
MIDKYARYQSGLSMSHLYPDYGDGLCGCGCGRPLTGRRRRWASDECQQYALSRFLVIKGDVSEIRKQVEERDGGVCNLCSEKTYDWEAHHRIPVSLGGGGCDLSNFITLCRKCHKDVHRKKGEEQIIPNHDMGVIFF